MAQHGDGGLLEWLRGHNGAVPEADDHVGFYGLDLYSLHASFEAVVSYLAGVAPEAADRARERFSCFDHMGTDGADYAMQVAFGSHSPTHARRARDLPLGRVRRRLGW